MTVKSLGNLAVLRTFRVLRALKTVAVVPGEAAVAETISISHCPASIDYFSRFYTKRSCTACKFS